MKLKTPKKLNIDEDLFRIQCNNNVLAYKLFILGAKNREVKEVKVTRMTASEETALRRATIGERRTYFG